MSIEAMNWALQRTGMTPEAKLILICLADGCGATGRVCVAYPAMLAKRCCMSLDEMSQWLDTMECAGLIKTIHSDDEQVIFEIACWMFPEVRQ